jgi:hypothetical protein
LQLIPKTFEISDLEKRKTQTGFAEKPMAKRKKVRTISLKLDLYEKYNFGFLNIIV